MPSRSHTATTTHAISYDLAIRHIPRPPDAYPLADERLRVRLRMALGDARRPMVEWSDRQDWRGADHRAPMRWYTDDANYRYWEGEITPFEGRVRYVFRLDDPTRPDAPQRWFGESGATTIRPGAEWPDGYFHWPYLHRERLLDAPAWVRDAIGYEIFPERFARGNPPVAPEMTTRWPSQPQHDSFWGGDLVGLLDHVDYIAALGVNLLWLTPIFSSPTNHKYDVDDYAAIDSHFGDDELFANVVAACQARGIRILLDGVFNHSGLNFAPWRDVVSRGVASPYWGWFDIHGERPDIQARNYRTFAHTAYMPRLMTANPEVQAYLIERVSRWMKMGIAGWRLDVADEVDPSFWRAFRRAMRAIRPDAYLLGEIAYDAARWLEGDQFDGVMNYPLRRALLQFVAPPDRATPGVAPLNERLDAAGFLAAVGRVRSWYPGWATTAALNPLSTHDVPRFLTAVGGDARRWRLGLTFLLTYEGIPLVYYGDEVGLEGAYDPDCRRPMVWEPAAQNAEMLATTRTLVRLRAEWPALRGAGFRPLASGHPHVAAFLRGVTGREEIGAQASDLRESQTGDVALVALNTGEKAAIITLDLRAPADLPGALGWPAHATHAHDLLADTIYALADGVLTLTLPALGSAALVPASK